MTNEEITSQLKRFDELAATVKAIPGGLKAVETRRAEFLKKNPIITPHANTSIILKKFVTCHTQMLNLKEQVITLAPHSDSVLIIGESGTGKEIIARALHGDRIGNFIAINCAGLPEHLIESELFGHRRGAFTGAENEKDGLFKFCNEGTIFLDEIGELPLQVQAKLLRVLQDGEYRRVGSNIIEKTSARVVSATHHNLAALVGENKFRLDLYARLSTFELVTLPLRNRRCDIKLIADSLDSNGCIYDKIGEAWWNEIMKDNEKALPLNVRDIQRIVRRWQVFGKII